MQTTLLTIRQFSEKHPAFSEGGLRHLRFYAEKNGFSGAFVNIGRRVLIDEQRFFDIARHNQGSDAA